MKIGDKVVHIKAPPGQFVPFNHEVHENVGPPLVVGAIYVISAFHIFNGNLGLSFIGPKTCIWKPTREVIGYNSNGFRLLDELKEENRQSKSQTQSA